MKISVNLDTCQNMGQCVYEAPSVFALDFQGRLQYVDHADDGLLEHVESAQALCPTQSITIEPSDGESAPLATSR